jgi:hypothetical protein
MNINYEQIGEFTFQTILLLNIIIGISRSFLSFHGYSFSLKYPFLRSTNRKTY